MANQGNIVISDDHRLQNRFDVTFDPNVKLDNFEKIPLHEINKISANRRHFLKCIIDVNFKKDNELSDTLDIVKLKSDRLYVRDIQFEVCDFIGNNGGRKITFENCTFKGGYFGYSCFNDVNFISCKFIECSFSLTRFYRCQFDDACDFKKISISGGKTKFIDSVISPAKFIENIYIYATKEYCNKYDLLLDEQKFRMFSSMVKLSRNILDSVSKNGDDTYYYAGVKQLYKLKIKEKNHRRMWDLKRKSLTGNKWVKIKSFIGTLKAKIYIPVESLILNTLGFFNGWGASISRCVFFGLVILTSYSFVYGVNDYSLIDSGVPLASHIVKSIIKSFDITFLAGYTKYVLSSDDYGPQLLCLSNMLFGLIWYAISIPTIINKISVNRI